MTEQGRSTQKKLNDFKLSLKFIAIMVILSLIFSMFVA